MRPLSGTRRDGYYLSLAARWTVWRMFPINTFSIHDLLGFAFTAPVAAVFYLFYWTLGRRTLDLVFANLVGCCAAACVAVFLADNVVAQGQDAAAVSWAASASLGYIRGAYLLGLLSMPCQVHFILRHTGARSALSRHIWWVYAAFLATAPALWSQRFLAARSQPLAATSSWACAVPWQPVAGPLILAYFAAWCGVQGYSIWRLWRPAGGPARSIIGPLRRASPLRWAIVIQAGGGVASILGGTMGYAGPSLFAATSVVAAALVAWALVQDRIDTELGKQRMERELEIASEIQQGLLPRCGPAVGGFDAAGWCRPADHAGGDIFDFFALPDGRWLIALADATGHGIGPALIICQTRALLRALAARCDSLAKVLREVQALLEPDLPEGHFVTCFLGVLEPEASRLTYVSAGQGPIVFYDRQAERFDVEGSTHLPLPLAFEAVGAAAAADPAAAAPLRRTFRPGDFMVLVSDGVVDCCDEAGRPLGLERLLDLLGPWRDLGAADMVARTRQEVERLIGASPAQDDLTMVVLRRC